MRISEVMLPDWLPELKLTLSIKGVDAINVYTIDFFAFLLPRRYTPGDDVSGK